MEQTPLPVVIMLWTLAIIMVGCGIGLLYSLFILLYIKTKSIKSLEVLNQQSRIREIELEKLKTQIDSIVLLPKVK